MNWHLGILINPHPNSLSLLSLLSHPPPSLASFFSPSLSHALPPLKPNKELELLRPWRPPSPPRSRGHLLSQRRPSLPRICSFEGASGSTSPEMEQEEPLSAASSVSLTHYQSTPYLERRQQEFLLPSLPSDSRENRRWNCHRVPSSMERAKKEVGQRKSNLVNTGQT